VNSRELVYKTLNFENRNERVPRQLWSLPWAEEHAGKELAKIKRDFPDDIVSSPSFLHSKTIAEGAQYTRGEYTDEWGCKFTNIHDGIIGEAKESLIQEDDWSDWEKIHIPVEWLDFDVEKVNCYCKNTDKFVIAGCCPRPFEQLQFIRTTEKLYMDLIDQPDNMLLFMNKMKDFYCELLEKWAKTDVDALNFMDDWGAQRSLLINPAIWERMFRPFYKEFIDIAHRHNKKIFMHSDGNTLDIYPRLIELGLDALNSQIFCMGVDNLEKYRGEITFWGEVDRQHILPEGSREDVIRAVHQIKSRLWENGGCIAQCEFGPGAKPENVYQVFAAWDDKNI